MPAETPTPLPLRPRSTRGGRALLLASLAVNALFVGGLASALVRHGLPPPGPARINVGVTGPVGLIAYVNTLPADRNHAIIAQTGRLRQGMGPLRREARFARDQAFRALTVEPFDKAAFIAAQSRLIEIENRQRQAQRDLIAELAGLLTPAERKAYVEWHAAAQPQPQAQPLAPAVTQPGSFGGPGAARP